MGLCQSAGLPGKGGVVDDGSEACPTVFELERTLEKRRGAATRLHVNLVNQEFRRGFFEVYRRGYAEEGGGGGGGDEGGDGEEDGEVCIGGGEDSGPSSGNHQLDSIAIAGNPSAAAAAAAAVSASAAAARKKKPDGVESGSFVATHKVIRT